MILKGLSIALLCALSTHAFGVIGGERANGAYPQIIRLEIFKDGKAVSLCSGSIVGQKTILTAAHCLVNTRIDVFETDGRRIEIDHGSGREPIFAYAIPTGFRNERKRLDLFPVDASASRREQLLKIAGVDLALLYTKRPIARDGAPMEIGAEDLAIGEKVEFAGFGEVHETGRSFYPRELFLGENRLFAKAPGALILRSGGGGAITSLGDSGGPMLDADQRITGVLSGGGVLGGERESFFVNLSGWVTWLKARIR